MTKGVARQIGEVSVLQKAAAFQYVRVTDAKEVGVGNPAEETSYHPDAQFNAKSRLAVKT